MNPTKRLSLGLLAAILTFCILAVAVLTSVNAVFGKPDKLKSSLVESKVYDGVAAGIADQAGKDAKQDPSSDLQLDNAVVQDVMHKVITPAKIQGYAEQIVDGTYHWLEGDVAEPDFKVDLSTIKQDLGTSLGDTAVQRLETLPVCTPKQLRTLDTRNIDPFTLPCRPPGINLAAERQKLVNQVAGNQDVLEDTKVTADDTKSESGETPFEKLAFVPTVFQWSKTLPWVLGVLGLAAAAGMIFMHTNRRSGIKAVAKPLLTTGILLLLGIAVSSFLLGRLRFDAQATESQYLQEAMISLVRSLSGALNHVLLIFALVYTALGAGGLIWLKTTDPKSASAPNPKINK